MSLVFCRVFFSKVFFSYHRRSAHYYTVNLDSLRYFGVNEGGAVFEPGTAATSICRTKASKPCITFGFVNGGYNLQIVHSLYR